MNTTSVRRAGGRVLVAWCLVAATVAGAAEIRIDCAVPHGTVRPLHGVNNGPLERGGIVDLSAWHRAIAVPLARLHDVHWPNADAVDIHTIYPDWRADPARPDSYRFARTDEYLQAIVDVGASIVYRLGESIEHTKRKVHVHPPADPDKWTAACLGIIRHYNEGWADGFRHGIRYWEIWNEPENRPAMWTGTPEQYYRLYTTTAKAIKARWPDLKVGGPAAGYQGEYEGGALQPSTFLTGFIGACKREGAPLDFFSWHIYTDDPAEPGRRARALRRWLDRQGFSRAELHLNDWNYIPDNDWTPISPAC